MTGCPCSSRRQRYAEWLDPSVQDLDSLRSLLVPAAPGRLTAYPVSKDVNNVRNDGAHLIEPLQLEERKRFHRHPGRVG